MKSKFLLYGEIAISDIEVSVSTKSVKTLLMDKLIRYGIHDISSIILYKRLGSSKLFLWEKYNGSVDNNIIEERINNGWCRINLKDGKRM